MQYSGIYIIYNPNSTGDSEAMANELQGVLIKKMVGMEVEAIPTERAGHAEELAQEIASRSKNPLIVSSSGDGGYNEVVNGAMKAGNKEAIYAVLPAGNANDHSRVMQNKPLADQIIKHKTKKIDLIKVTVRAASGKDEIKYAHSYVGLGLTPVVATELNRHTLNAFREMQIVLRTFIKYRPFKIKHNNKVLKLDSLLFANINQMAKVLSLAPTNQPDDGKFEVVLFPAGRKWQLLKRLTEAAILHLDKAQRMSSYEFETIKKMPMQLDGEVMAVQIGSHVTIDSIHKALTTII